MKPAPNLTRRPPRPPRRERIFGLLLALVFVGVVAWVAWAVAAARTPEGRDALSPAEADARG